MIKINVILNNTIWKRYLKNPHSYIEKKLKVLNKKNKLHKKIFFTCSLLLAGSSKIKKLNKKFRKKNKSTDILSFPFHTKKTLSKKLKKEKEIYLGDMIINISKISDKNDIIKFQKNFNKLWVHGLVHLFGYEHKKDQDFLLMERIEKRYLNYIK